MEIIEFLKSHELINVRGLEKKLGFPNGTIRLDGSRGISEKNQKLIFEVLSGYGLSNNVEMTSKILDKVSLDKQAVNKKEKIKSAKVPPVGDKISKAETPLETKPETKEVLVETKQEEPQAATYKPTSKPKGGYRISFNKVFFEDNGQLKDLVVTSGVIRQFRMKQLTDLEMLAVEFYLNRTPL